MSTGNGAIITHDGTLVTDTDVMASGDVLSDVVEIPNVFSPATLSVIIQSICVVDDAAQDGAFELVFLDAATSIGTVNAAVSTSDAVAASIVGMIPVLSADYGVSSVGWSVATPTFNPIVVRSGTARLKSLWVAAISTDTSTAAATDDLKLRIGILS